MSLMISNMISNPIRNSVPDPAHAPAAAEETKKITGTQAPDAAGRLDETGCLEESTESHPLTPARDEYTPEEKQEPTGRYWLEQDESGRTKIHFDDPNPDRTQKDEKAEAPSDSEKISNEKKAETCTANTDKVDREIERLKKKQAELEQQLNTETDERKIKQLESELVRVEGELRQKDNDTYRRQHTQFTYS